jgi:hypothetical protein
LTFSFNQLKNTLLKNKKKKHEEKQKPKNNKNKTTNKEKVVMKPIKTDWFLSQDKNK